MVPGQCGDSGIRKNLADRGDQRIERQFRAKSKVQHALSRVGGRRLRADERPAAVKDFPPQLFRDIQGCESGRAEGRHQQHELEIRHARMLDIQGLHDDNINRGWEGSQFLTAAFGCMVDTTQPI